MLGRIEKQIIEATKQCRRSYLMEISEARKISEILGEFDATKQRCFIAHPYDAQPMKASAEEDSPKECVWLIGPEGGFTDEEVAQAVAAGWQAISFGEIILRVETAAMMAAMESRKRLQR